MNKVTELAGLTNARGFVSNEVTTKSARLLPERSSIHYTSELLSKIRELKFGDHEKRKAWLSHTFVQVLSITSTFLGRFGRLNEN